MNRQEVVWSFELDRCCGAVCASCNGAANSPWHCSAWLSFDTATHRPTRADEPLGLAIGLWPVRPGELVLRTQAVANSLDRKAAPLSVSERLTHTHPTLRKERDDFVLLLVGMHGGESDALMVIDGRKQHLPACTIDRATPVARDDLACHCA